MEYEIKYFSVISFKAVLSNGVVICSGKSYNEVESKIKRFYELYKLLGF